MATTAQTLTNDEVLTLSLEEASRAIYVCINADIPVCLWGESGFGKSAILRKLALAIMHEFRDVRIGQHDPSEFAIPIPIMPNGQIDEEFLKKLSQAGSLEERNKLLEILTSDTNNKNGYKVVYATADYIPFEEHVQDRKIILAFEEIDRGSVAMQNACLSLMMEREFAQHKLGPNVRIVAAGNGASDAGATNRLGEAAERRMVHLYLNHKSIDTRDAIIKHGTDNNWNRECLTTYRKLWDKICKKDDPFRFYAYGQPCGRTMEYVSRIVNSHKAGNLQVDTSDIIEPLICGTVGTALGKELWMDISTRLEIDIELVFNNPTNADLPDTPDKIITWQELIADELGVKRGPNKVKACDNAITWADRLPAEQSIGVVNKLVEVCGEAKTAGKNYKVFCEKHGIVSAN